MKSLVSTTSRKVKSVEVKMSNMTFVVNCEMTFIRSVKNPSWSTPKFTAVIKETGEKLSTFCGKKFLKNQMELINSKPHLFLHF
jgi:hypothetical protein